ncbi:MAG: glutathione S-transferase domain-containing protein [Pseudomonadota bacterium]|nr:MAG: hypothetical protein DIU78_08480 [Pseudomonadota bacterium]
MALDREASLVLFGRSSSHFTRVARIFAAEAGLEPVLRVVRDLRSQDPNDYGGNPALRIPVLETEQGVWFGALNVSRELVRRAARPVRVVWPEALDTPLLANAQELTLQAMATEVWLIIGKLGGAADDPSRNKAFASLRGMLAWLDRNVAEVLAGLPAERDVSFLEVALYCLVTHLEFREIVPTSPYPELRKYCEHFARRPSAERTPYHFDP